MTNKARVALFIDAENASPEHIEDYLNRCREIGKPTIARCYGGVAGLKAWDAQISKHHLVPVQTPPSASKSNASDFALTIDAVSLLHRGLFDHAVIASSDADFTLLAIHIREHGKGIDGVGEAKAKASLKSSFDNFTVIGKTPAARPAARTPAKSAAAAPAKRPAATSTTIDKDWLNMTFDKVSNGNEDCSLQTFARELVRQRPDYKKGFRTVDNYLKKSGLFAIESGRVSRIKP